MNKFVILVFSFISMSAFAGNLDCASADSSLKYSYSSPDGGAPRNPETSLILNNVVLIAISGFTDGSEIIKAKFELIGIAKILEQKKQDDYKIKWFSQKVKVTSLDQAATELFKEYVICKQVIYSGLPRP